RRVSARRRAEGTVTDFQRRIPSWCSRRIIDGLSNDCLHHGAEAIRLRRGRANLDRYGGLMGRRLDTLECMYALYRQLQQFTVTVGHGADHAIVERLLRGHGLRFEDHAGESLRAVRPAPERHGQRAGAWGDTQTDLWKLQFR